MGGGLLPRISRGIAAIGPILLEVLAHFADAVGGGFCECLVSSTRRRSAPQKAESVLLSRSGPIIRTVGSAHSAVFSGRRALSMSLFFYRSVVYHFSEVVKGQRIQAGHPFERFAPIFHDRSN